MNSHRFWSFGKVGLETLRSSILFFYGHVSLVLISLIPSLTRGYQLLNVQTPIWLEVTVGLTRIFLVIWMICLLSNNSLKMLRDKQVWNRIGKSITIQLEKSWPYRFTAQIIVFIVFIVGLGNLLIQLLANSTLPMIIDFFSLQSYDYIDTENAYVYFLKNITVIPLTMVFMLKMIGIESTKN